MQNNVRKRIHDHIKNSIKFAFTRNFIFVVAFVDRIIKIDQLLKQQTNRAKIMKIVDNFIMQLLKHWHYVDKRCINHDQWCFVNFTNKHYDINHIQQQKWTLNIVRNESNVFVYKFFTKFYAKIIKRKSITSIVKFFLKKQKKKKKMNVEKSKKRKLNYNVKSKKKKLKYNARKIEKMLKHWAISWKIIIKCKWNKCLCNYNDKWTNK